MEKITKENLLDAIETFGRDIVRMSKPNYWSYEDVYKADSWKKLVPIARQAYRMVRDGDEIKGLVFLKDHLPGIMANHINLLIIANTTGFKETSSWKVENGQLVFKPKNKKET